MSQRQAVSILLSPDLDSRRTLLVRRNPILRFMGGYLAFPGGTLDDEDYEIPVSGGERDVAPFVAAAARELLEEVGLWMARGERPAAARLREMRRALVDGEGTFASFLDEAGGHLDARDFTPVGKIETPPFAPRRYDTWFLACRLPADQEVEIWPGELTEGALRDADESLAAWAAGGAEIVPPVLIFLREIARSSVRGCLAEMRRLTASFQAGELHPVFFSPGVLLAPLEARTKPPATHTNAYVVGRDRLYLVDPAAVSGEEQARLWRLLDGLLAEGARLEGLLLTHAHPDHVGALAAARRRYEVPVLAHALAADRLPAGAALDRALQEGESLDLGTAPDGSSDWRLEIFEMPGHAPDHLAFRESRYGATLVGDLVSTLSSVLIEPGEGHLATYLSSLERLQEIARSTLYPGHGPPSREGWKTVQQQIAHRGRREEDLLDALAGGAKRPREIVALAYQDVDRRLWPLAERSVRAGLIKLQEEGRARAEGGRYRLVDLDPMPGQPGGES